MNDANDPGPVSTAQTKGLKKWVWVYVWLAVIALVVLAGGIYAATSPKAQVKLGFKKQTHTVDKLIAPTLNYTSP